jgi:hypothetical protein
MTSKLFINELTSLVEASKASAASKAELLACLDNMTTQVPIVYTPTDVAPLSKASFNRIEPPSIGTGSIIKVLELHDGSFLVVFSDVSALHYSSNWTLIGALPFNFDSPSITANGYAGVVDALAINYNTANTLVLMCISDEHVVQGYNYDGTSWKFKDRIGTIASAGNTAGLLSTPVAIGGFFDADTSLVHLAISNHGVASNTKTSFIKIFTTAADITSITEVAETMFPGSVTTVVADEGKLIKDEISLATRVAYPAKNALWVVNATEFGKFDTDIDFGSHTPQVQVMSSGDMKEIDYNDIITNPSNLVPLASGLILGDSNGHLVKIDGNLTTDSIFSAGNFVANTAATDYPFNFGVFTDLQILASGDLLVVSKNRIYTTDFHNLSDSTITVVLPVVEKSYKILEMVGFSCDIPIEIIKDQDAPVSLCDFTLNQTVVTAGTVVKLRITVPKETLLNKTVELKKGVVIIEFI